MTSGQSNALVGAIGIAGTVLFTVYGQLVIKWRLDQVLGSGDDRSVGAIIRAALDPWIVSGFVGAGIAAVFWLIALSRLPLSAAYPFMALSFVMVLILSGTFLGEHVGPSQFAGIALIAAGLVVGALV